MFIHKRQQELITLLLQDKEWHTLEEIARYLKCSVKTVRRDLRYLKDYLPSEWSIQVEKGKGVMLYKPPYSSSTSIYSFFKKNDMTFQILDHLLRGNINTVASLAKALYMQVSSLSTVFQNVQEYLDRFNLRLQKNPLRISGNETHIIYMFYELYCTTYRLEDCPFSNKNEISQYILKLEKNLNINFYPMYKQKLVYLLAITLQRKKQGHKIQISPAHIKHVINSPFYTKIKMNSHTLCGIRLTEIEYKLITIAVNCCIFTPPGRDIDIKYVLQHFYDKNIPHDQYVDQLITQLECEFKVTLKQDQEFVFNLLQYIRKVSYRYQVLPTIASKTSEFHTQVKQHHYKTFCKVKKIYTKWLQKYPLIPYVYEEDVIAITLQLQSMLQLTQSFQKKVLLYLGDGVLWKRYIQGVLYSELGNKIIISTEEILDIYTCDIQNLDVDCILTTIPLVEVPKPVIQISVLPTKREIDDIKALVDTARKRNVF